MLLELQISNYALIRSLHVSFDTGFTVITGETGAGKSILLGALSLILGNRADTSVLFDKSKKCIVEAVFDIKGLGLEDFFEQCDIDYNDNTIVRREITERGKSRAFVNDTPVVLTVLKELASKLVDIHSQHNNLLLGDSSFRMKVLDAYAKNSKLLSEYKKVYSEYIAAELEYHNLALQQQRGLEERGFLEYTLAELEAARISVGEQDELESKIAFLSNAQTIKQKLYDGVQAFSDDEGGVVGRVREVMNGCIDVAGFDPRLREFADRLDSVVIELKDLAFEFSKMEDSVEVSPDELVRLQERLDVINSLEQKYRVDDERQLLEKLETTRAKLDAYTDNSERMEKLRVECARLRDSAERMGKQLSESRSKVAAKLSEELVDKLQLLGMPDAKMEVKVEPDIGNLKPDGIDEVAFLFSANKGTALTEIEKAASGGEISRVMLAIKSVITTNSYLPTVIFDEIDTGISGEVAAKTAKVMEELASQRQLLVITHLPQIAAKAKLHYFVYKTVENGMTYTQIRLLDDTERETEIAKMISGSAVSASARRTAAELMNL